MRNKNTLVNFAQDRILINKTQMILNKVKDQVDVDKIFP